VWHEYAGNSNWNHKTIHNTTPAPTPPALPLPPPAKKTLTLAHSSEKKTPSLAEQKGFVKEYLKSVGVQFEIVAAARDLYGASYLALMDSNNPSLNVRLYLKKSDPMHGMVGRSITGDIGSHTMKNSEGFIFKVAPQTVKVCPEKDENYLIYKGANGKLFTKKEWEQRFPNCAWCFDPLFAEDHGNRLTSQNDCLCGTCSDNPDATEGVTLSKIY
jgi:hypothetical protein